MKVFIRPLLLLGLSAWVGRAHSGEKPFFRSGDHVAFIGNTLVERSRHFGEIETALQLAAGPGVSGLVFRNIGWSGDSVYGDARSYFGTPSEGRERLSQVLKMIQPQVVFVCYGTGAAMSVDQGWTNEPIAAKLSAGGLVKSLTAFREGYEQMLDRIHDSSGKGLRDVVLLSPPPLENLGPPLPDQRQNNKNLARFRDVIRDLAKEKGLGFIDLFGRMGGDDFSGKISKDPLTDDGIHFGDEGYRLIARQIVEGLGYQNRDEVRDSAQQIARLRGMIVEKNELFFNRWRPANETYLFLFRKHEQGQNAKEIPEFDPLIKAREKQIAELRSRILKGRVKQ